MSRSNRDPLAVLSEPRSEVFQGIAHVSVLLSQLLGNLGIDSVASQPTLQPPRRRIAMPLQRADKPACLHDEQEDREDDVGQCQDRSSKADRAIQSSSLSRSRSRSRWTWMLPMSKFFDANTSRRFNMYPCAISNATSLDIPDSTSFL